MIHFPFLVNFLSGLTFFFPSIHPTVIPLTPHAHLFVCLLRNLTPSLFLSFPSPAATFTQHVAAHWRLDNQREAIVPLSTASPRERIHAAASRAAEKQQMAEAGVPDDALGSDQDVRWRRFALSFQSR